MAIKRKPTKRKSAMKFNVVHGRGAKFTGGGLRGFFAYRDLGIERSTAGRFGATHIKATRACPAGQGTGWHRHRLGFQMVYLLKGWAKFAYDGHGVMTLRPGSCIHQPPGIRHELVSCSRDCEMLEITSPAAFDSVPAKRA